MILAVMKQRKQLQLKKAQKTFFGALLNQLSYEALLEALKCEFNFYLLYEEGEMRCIGFKSYICTSIAQCYFVISYLFYTGLYLN